jgi:hypothetical protein
VSSIVDPQKGMREEPLGSLTAARLTSSEWLQNAPEGVSRGFRFAVADGAAGLTGALCCSGTSANSLSDGIFRADMSCAPGRNRPLSEKPRSDEPISARSVRTRADLAHQFSRLVFRCRYSLPGRRGSASDSHNQALVTCHRATAQW